MLCTSLCLFFHSPVTSPPRHQLLCFVWKSCVLWSPSNRFLLTRHRSEYSSSSVSYACTSPALIFTPEPCLSHQAANWAWQVAKRCHGLTAESTACLHSFPPFCSPDLNSTAPKPQPSPSTFLPWEHCGTSKSSCYWCPAYVFALKVTFELLMSRWRFLLTKDQS